MKVAVFIVCLSLVVFLSICGATATLPGVICSTFMGFGVGTVGARLANWLEDNAV